MDRVSKLIRVCFFLLALFLVSCKKGSNELEWPLKLNQPATLTDKIWAQDPANRSGGYKTIEFIPKPQNQIIFTRYDSTRVLYSSWSYFPDDSIIVINKESAVSFTYFGCVIDGNKLEITLNERTFTFYN